MTVLIDGLIALPAGRVPAAWIRFIEGLDLGREVLHHRPVSSSGLLPSSMLGVSLMGISQGWVDRVEQSEAPPGDVEIFFRDGLTVIRLSGEVDLAMRRAFEQIECVATERGEPVQIDVAELTFIDSSGLGFLAALAAAGRRLGRPPVVVGASRRVREGLDLGGLSSVLDLTEST
jgi:anti-sigma B factor antagonist